ncbi:MAG: carbohydrate ABC transporter permease [Alphaproteobacteria bacterium]
MANQATVVDGLPGGRWRRLIQLRRTQRHSRGLLTYGFLLAISIPLLIPYSWLVARSFGITEPPVLWLATAVLLCATFGMWAWVAVVGDRRARVVGSLVIGAAVVVTIGADLSLEQFDFLSQPGRNSPIWRAFGNSLYLAMSQTVIVVSTASLSGYYISRFQFPMRNAMLLALISVHGVPVMALFVPLFVMLHWVGLLDSLTGAMLVLVGMELPFAVFVMKGAFDAVPWEMEMAAIADGASRRQAFLRIILPQVTSGMVAVSVFTFIRGWEEYIFVSIFMVNSANWVMSLFLFYQDNAAAVALFYMLPPFLAFVFAQKYLFRLPLGRSGP